MPGGAAFTGNNKVKVLTTRIDEKQGAEYKILKEKRPKRERQGTERIIHVDTEIT